MALEANKKELVLSINVFNKPTELSGPKAWCQLILNLCFLRPGTFPSVPDMGVGIQDYEYEFIDSTISILNTKINDQVRTYLPDIPLESVKVKSVDGANGEKILMIVINLIDNGAIVTEVIAAEIKNKLINFEISWAN